jgi:hypothetical protein
MPSNQLKHQYLQAIGITVMVLALVRCAFPGIARQEEPEVIPETIILEPLTNTSSKDYKIPEYKQHTAVRFLHPGESPHPIHSVYSYGKCFPDSNHVQLKAAQFWGVPPVKDRADAEMRKDELVFIGNSPYYTMAHLDASIPYLVPRAAILLHDIGRNFFDSLQVKGLPLHWLTVSSVLRTEYDVSRLRRQNQNATEQSCHLYGTTFDINYNQYQPIDPQHSVTDDKLKFVLSEVLRDLRQDNRCYIRYEVRQPCFHITVR